MKKIISLTNGHVYIVEEDEAENITRVTSRFANLRNGDSIQISMIVDICDVDRFKAQEKISLKNKGLYRCNKCYTINRCGNLCECQRGQCTKEKLENRRKESVPIIPIEIECPKNLLKDKN